MQKALEFWKRESLIFSPTPFLTPFHPFSTLSCFFLPFFSFPPLDWHDLSIEATLYHCSAEVYFSFMKWGFERQWNLMKKLWILSHQWLVSVDFFPQRVFHPLLFPELTCTYLSFGGQFEHHILIKGPLSLCLALRGTYWLHWFNFQNEPERELACAIVCDPGICIRRD